MNERMKHSEQVEKKERERGFYPQINRCAVCGYTITSRKGVVGISGLLASLLLVVATIMIAPPAALSILLLVGSVGCLIVFGIASEIEMRRFSRMQRRNYLERLDQ